LDRVRCSSEMSELRRDPEDGKVYSFDELSAYYKGKYNKGEVKAYWEKECTPIKTKKDKAASAEPKAEAKAKAKVKAKAKATAKERPERGPANPKRFINEESTIVQDAMDGLIWSTPNVARLDSYPDIKVVFRTDWDKGKVAIISGGGAGHEPMHGGFVGKGMLTAAISGETFASPTIDAVFAAIVHVTGAKGCLLVIKNYTGDRLNFTLAAQKAKTLYGLEVETVLTKDDVATVAERGIAGTLFVHKLCGALAEAGKSLAEVKAAAEAVIDSTASMGVSMSSVRRLKPEMIAQKKMELGLGIHGEPGSKTLDIASATVVVGELMEQILASGRMKAEAPHGYACLVNNLGAVPQLEMCIMVSALMKSKWAGSIKLLLGPAPLCTSLDMNGMSLSLLRLTPQFADLLSADTACAAWPKAVAPCFPAPVAGIKLKDMFDDFKPSSDAVISALLEKACKALIDAKGVLDTLDSKVGDADCGSTLASAGAKIMEAMDKMPFADPAGICACLGGLCANSMGGSSGVLMSIMFIGMAAELSKSGSKSWAEAGPKAFMAGLEAMMAAGGASKGSRTMLDALLPAAEALLEGKGLAGASAAADGGVEATKNTPPSAGRSENVPESKWRGIEDPGAKAVSIVFAAISK